MTVAMYDEGKKNEKIGEGIFKLHEVIDKGELDGMSAWLFACQGEKTIGEPGL